MEIFTEIIQVSTKGFNDIVDITPEVQSIVHREHFTEGSALVFCVGSTGGITVVEFEPGLVKTDLPQFFEKLAPYKGFYEHHNTWGDDNGAAHVRASLLGSSFTVPFKDSQLILGTWQQIILIDFDTGARSRKIAVQLTGMKN